VFVLMCLAQLTTGSSSRTPKRPYLILVDGDGLAVVGSMKIGDPNGFWTAGAEGVSSAVSEIKLVFSIPLLYRSDSQLFVNITTTSVACATGLQRHLTCHFDESGPGSPNWAAKMRAETGCGGVAVLRLGKKSGAAAVNPHRRPNRRGVVPAVLSLTPLGFGLSSQETVGLVAAIMAQGVVTLRDRMARIQVSASGLIAIRVTSECIAYRSICK
jgi:hypothetical protein